LLQESYTCKKRKYYLKKTNLKDLIDLIELKDLLELVDLLELKELLFDK